MASLNKVSIIGNLGKDPEVRYMKNGDAVANLSVATTDSWKDKNGEKQEKTEWHKVTLYKGLAEVAGEYLKKGGSVYIEGRMETNKWNDKEGKEQQTTEIVASDMKMLSMSKSQQAERQPEAQQKARAVSKEMAGEDIPF